MQSKSHLSYQGKKGADVWVTLLEYCEEVIMARSDPATHSPDGWSSGSFNSLRTKPTIFTHQVVFIECTHPDVRKSDWGNSPFTSMNLLIKVVACLGVSPVGNSCFIEPESNSRISQLWPTGKDAWLDILPIATPDCALTMSQSMYQQRDRECKYDSRNICSMLGKKKRRSLIWRSHL